MEKHWFVFYTKPRNEKKATERLIRRGYDMYCPLVHTVRQWSDRKKKVATPMFNSYIFGHLTELERTEVVQDPAIVTTIFWSGKPALMRQDEVEMIRRIEEKGQEVTVERNELKPGNPVRIKDGPFKGLEGIIQAIDNHRFRVEVPALQSVITFRYHDVE